MPAIQVADLNDGKIDVDHIGAFANSAALTAIDRLGRTKRTLAGIDAEAESRMDAHDLDAETRMDAHDAAAIAQRLVIQADADVVLGSLGYLVPVPYAAALEMSAPNQSVSYDGNVYAPIQSDLPFTTSGVFEAAKFRLIQGVSGADIGAPNGALIVGFLQSGAGAQPRKVLDKARERVTPLDFMDVAMRADVLSGAPVMDHSAAIQAMFASGAKTFDLLSYRYNINWPESSHLVTFTGQSDITVQGRDAVLYDSRDYALDSVSAVFMLDACSNVNIYVNYEGVPLANPSNAVTGVGYRGATLVNCKNGCVNIDVQGELKHLRYGVRSGDYNTPAFGFNKKISTTLKTYRCGYPLAHYLAEDIQADLYCEGSHRTAYLAGVKGGTVYARFKDQYIAPIQVFLTDSKTGVGTSRGCSDLDVSARDMGSTIFTPNSWAAGISPSRVDPGTAYENIAIRFSVVGSDTVATTLGGFALYSNVKAVLPEFPFNWEQTITLRNIKVSGVIDRSAQTVATHGTGDVYLYTLDSGTHYATVSSVDLSDVVIKPGSGANPRAIFFYVPGLVDRASIRNCSFGNYDLEVLGNTTVPVDISDCGRLVRTSSNPSDTSVLRLTNTDITGTGQPAANVYWQNSKNRGSGALLKTVVRDASLSGASIVLGAMIPGGALLLGVEGKFSGITGATGIQFGVAGDTDRFADLDLTSGSFTPLNSAADQAGPLYYRSAATGILVSAKGGTFTGGTVTVTAQFYIFTPPD